MIHLIRSELVRFRSRAIAFAAVHILVLRLVAAFTDFFSPSIARLGLGVLVYGLAGLALGLNQLGSYRTLNQWTYLIHRPMDTRRIFGAIVIAGVTILAVTVAFPVWLITVYLDVWSPQLVDARQYLLAPYVLGISVAFYFGACYMSLSRNRIAVFVLVLSALFLNREASSAWVFVPLMVVVTWIGYLAFSVFKPDLTTHPKGPLALAAAAVPIQLSTQFFVWSAAVLLYGTAVNLRETGLSDLGSFGWDDYYPHGSLERVEYQSARAAIAHVLKTGGTERSRQIVDQLDLAAATQVTPDAGPFPHRHQPGFLDGQITLTDPDRETVWTFSHDRMLFRGRSIGDRAILGWLGVATAAAVPGAIPLPAVPRIDGRFLLTPGSLYEFDGRRRRIEPRFHLPPDERAVHTLEVQNGIATLLSDRRLYFFETRDLTEPGALDPIASIELPVSARDIARIDIAELLDGFVVALLVERQSSTGFGSARQMAIEALIGGGQRDLASLSLDIATPEWQRFAMFVSSPLLDTSYRLIRSLVSSSERRSISLADVSARSIRPPVILGAIGMALGAALLTILLLRRRRLSARAQVTWGLVALIFGLPGLLSAAFLTTSAEHLCGREVPSRTMARTPVGAT